MFAIGAEPAFLILWAKTGHCLIAACAVPSLDQQSMLDDLFRRTRQLVKIDDKTAVSGLIRHNRRFKGYFINSPILAIYIDKFA
jgi:hypothetical protein